MNPIWRLRIALKAWAARHMLVIEFCGRCGVKQPLVWYADDDLWSVVTGRGPGDGGGICCPRCFDAMARRSGALVYWTAAREFRDSTYNDRRSKLERDRSPQ